MALAASSSAESGLPTRSERPTTTASAPSSATSWRRSISITPAGVHGRRPGRPLASSPAEIGVRPSTSLAGSISSVSARAVDLRRRRELEQDARDGRVVVEALQQPLDLLVGSRRAGAGGRSPRCRPRRRPSACRRRRPRTPGRRRRARSPGRASASPCSTHAATSARTSARTACAIALPSMISAAIAAGRLSSAPEGGEGQRRDRGEQQERHAVARSRRRAARCPPRRPSGRTPTRR